MSEPNYFAENPECAEFGCPNLVEHEGDECAFHDDLESTEWIRRALGWDVS